MKRRLLCSVCMAAIILLCPLAAADDNAGGTQAMQPLAEDEMEAVIGQVGVALLLDLRINADENGAPLASLSGCSGNGNPCRLAFKIANRESGSGEWLVLKDTWGRLFVDNLNIDGSFNPAGGTAYDNPDRFKDNGGTCLLAACEPANLPALKLSFGGATTSFENDIRIGLNLGRVAFEYGSTGYAADANGGFLGLQVRSTTQNYTHIDIDGAMRVYGY